MLKYLINSLIRKSLASNSIHFHPKVVPIASVQNNLMHGWRKKSVTSTWESASDVSLQLFWAITTRFAVTLPAFWKERLRVSQRHQIGQFSRCLRAVARVFEAPLAAKQESRDNSALGGNKAVDVGMMMRAKARDIKMPSKCCTAKAQEKARVRKEQCRVDDAALARHLNI